MKKENPSKENRETGRHEHALPNEINDKEKKQAILAHREAEKDIDHDPDLAESGPNDDLDEGETARLGGDRTDLV